MNLKLAFSGILVVVAIVSAYFLISMENENESNFSDRAKVLELLSNITPVNISQQGAGEIILGKTNSIFEVWGYSGDLVGIDEDGTEVYKEVHFLLKPENDKIYSEIGIINEPHNSVIVVPIFTLIAYDEPGFYNYYREECNTTCITDLPIRYDLRYTFESSVNAIKILRLLGYPYITDIEIAKNPDILNLFDKVILLHSEYVTSEEFESITQHPKVVYLYPNALYAEVEYNHEEDKITLIRGHGYPSSEIKNGFEWKFDNTHPFEYDIACEDWEFFEIKNGIMLNCYPDNMIFQDEKLLKVIKEY